MLSFQFFLYFTYEGMFSVMIHVVIGINSIHQLFLVFEQYNKLNTFLFGYT